VQEFPKKNPDKIEISLYITKFKKKRSDIREKWTEMLRCIMDICRTNNVEKYECAKLCHQFSRISDNYREGVVDAFFNENYDAPRE
jgi:DNA mismatch repair ATPase MutS